MRKINNKVLLTGISGYIGLHCAVELLKNGYIVKVHYVIYLSPKRLKVTYLNLLILKIT